MSFPQFANVADSRIDWLGSVPTHWRIRRLKHACEVFPSNVDKHTREDESPILLCNYTDVYYNERITVGMDFMLATASQDQVKRFTLRAGDTIITKDSETADDIAIAAYVPDDLPGVVCGYHLSMVRAREDTCGAFVKRLFDSIYAKSCFAVAANGLTRVGLGQYALENVSLPFPPRKEQVIIAAFLDRETAKIDELVEEQQRLIELLKEKRQAVISQAVTKGLDPTVPMKDSGVEWLGQVPAHWALTRLKHATSLIIDCPHETPAYCDDGEFAVIRTADISDGLLDLSNAYRLDAAEFVRRTRRSELAPDDIVYSREGERWGHAALVPSQPACCLGQRMMQFRANGQFLPLFLMWALNSEFVYRQGQVDTVGATSPHVNVETIRNYVLMQPPVDEQAMLAQVLSRDCTVFDDLIAEAGSTIALLWERRAALISAAVTGKIDVRDLLPQPEMAPA